MNVKPPLLKPLMTGPDDYVSLLKKPSMIPVHDLKERCRFGGVLGLCFGWFFCLFVCLGFSVVLFIYLL